MAVFYIFVRVNGRMYLSKVQACSAAAAEHMALDRGVCGIHEYGCDACTAYGEEAMFYDGFGGMCLHADPVSFEALCELIDENNARIQRRDAAQEKKWKKQREVEHLRAHLDKAEQELREAENALANA